jgi:hypothetical protein
MFVVPVFICASLLSGEIVIALIIVAQISVGLAIISGKVAVISIISVALLLLRICALFSVVVALWE